MLGLSSLSITQAADLAVQRAAVAALDGYIERALHDWQVPGAAVGVIKDDTVIFAKGYGVREIGQSAPVDTGSLFEIGSLTKAMTAAALAVLVDEGKLRWDDPVVDYLPQFRLADPWVSTQVTVRDLLAHRVGFEGGTETVVPMSSRQVLQASATLRKFAPFRDTMLYSNALYDIAGELVTAVSGMSWAQFVEQRLFKPLQMSDSHASVDTARLWKPEHLAPSMYGQAPAGRASIVDALHPNVTMPHWHTPEAVRPVPWQISLRGGAAAGSAVANLDDLLRWTRFHLSDGRGVLQPATLEELHAAQALMRGESPSSSFDATWRTVAEVSPNREPAAYALGWFRNHFRGHIYLDHGGALLGAMSDIAMLPEQGIGVVVLANSYGRGGVGLFNTAVILRIVDVLLKAPPHDWNAVFLRQAQEEESRKSQTEARLQAARIKDLPSSVPLARYAGEYRNAQGIRVQIEQAGKDLLLRLPGTFSWRLEHWQGDMFRMHVSTAGVELMKFFATFRVGAEGRVESFDSGWALLGGTFEPVR
ncbi:MAG TPA: serine hydrolase [Povalibacter sp.]|nr:serine hydrolase [Povalibacter sp.]